LLSTLVRVTQIFSDLIMQQATKNRKKGTTQVDTPTEGSVIPEVAICLLYLYI